MQHHFTQTENYMSLSTRLICLCLFTLAFLFLPMYEVMVERVNNCDTFLPGSSPFTNLAKLDVEDYLLQSLHSNRVKFGLVYSIAVPRCSFIICE